MAGVLVTGSVSCESLQEPLGREWIVTGPPAQVGAVAGCNPSFGPQRAGRGRGQCGQATKGVWGMSGRQEAMKGVEDCDKPGGTVKRVLIPGYPNWHPVNP